MQGGICGAKRDEKRLKTESDRFELELGKPSRLLALPQAELSPFLGSKNESSTLVYAASIGHARPSSITGEEKTLLADDGGYVTEVESYWSCGTNRDMDMEVEPYWQSCTSDSEVVINVSADESDSDVAYEFCSFAQEACEDEENLATPFFALPHPQEHCTTSYAIHALKIALEDVKSLENMRTREAAKNMSLRNCEKPSWNPLDGIRVLQAAVDSLVSEFAGDEERSWSVSESAAKGYLVLEAQVKERDAQITDLTQALGKEQTKNTGLNAVLEKVKEEKDNLEAALLEGH
ncbi:hypothetical protein Moror_12179 [Moniliophthora roreri MCA 2997]|uniref:Uncharacterized protein n=1 Tax=Moniliophthora roreri (strain MCA 2997) TaxID=1381753 RepID=V2XSH9_MONRO|nr:hypothetical protein Moror_12179 [Moniliophthora roreri MCA 2997]